MASPAISSVTRIRQAVRGRLASTVLLRVLPAAGLVLLALATVLWALGGAVTAEASLARARAQVEAAAARLGGRLEGDGHSAVLLARLLAQLPGDEKRDRALLAAGAVPSEAYEAFLLRPPVAMVLMSGRAWPTGIDPASRPWYAIAMAAGDSYAFVPPYVSAVEKRVIFSVVASAPTAQGRCVVGLDLAVERILAEVRSFDRTALRVRVVDGGGRWILNDDSGQVLGGRIEGGLEGALWRRYCEGSGQTVTEKSGDLHRFIVPVPAALGWALVADLPAAAVDAPGRQLALIALLGTAIALLVLALLLALASRSIARPVVRLAAMAERVKDGDLTVRAGPGGDDELGVLGRRFDDLVEGLREREAMRVQLAESQAIQARLSGELNLARELKQAVRPAHLPAIPGLGLAALLRPGERSTSTFHDVVPLDADGVAFLLGEVHGEGVPAALLLAQLSIALRLACRATQDPVGTLALANTLLAGRAEGGISATATVVVCHPGARRIVVASAGRPRPLLVLRSGTAEWVQGAQGGRLGLLAELIYHSTPTTLEPGETCLLFSEAVVEARNAAGQPFGDDRLVRAARAAAAAGPAALVAACSEAVAAHLGAPPAQDLLLLAWRPDPAAPQPDQGGRG